jgi:hypothetical protein
MSSSISSTSDSATPQSGHLARPSSIYSIFLWERPTHFSIFELTKEDDQILGAVPQNLINLLFVHVLDGKFVMMFAAAG